MRRAPLRRLTLRRVGAVIKRRLPTSLYGRSLLIIVAPIALMQLAVTWAFFDAHWRTVTSRLSDGLAGDVAWAVEAWGDDPTPPGLARLADRGERTLNLSIALQPGRRVPVERRPSIFAPLDVSLKRALADRLDQPVWFDTTRYPAFVDIRVQTPQGVLRILAPRERAFATQAHIFILWLGGATVLLTAVAVLFIRNQTRAIERLAEAADSFGRGGPARPFKPHGAREVRQAAKAFLAMQARIGRHLEQRTALLASVSHDLRTPLTRMKLTLALAPDDPETQEAVGPMQRDLADMEQMIEEYLAFARGEGGETPAVTPLLVLAEQAADGARRDGADVRIHGDAAVAAAVRPLALRRALANLIDNAVGHARRVEVTVEAPRPAGGGAGGGGGGGGGGGSGAASGPALIVDDDGPGIPAAQREEAFKPFNRLDEARNQNRRGVGLGLAIARDVARSHGGDLTLSESPLGGLRATLRLPG